MSALKNIVTGVLLICLCAAVSYLGLQYAALQTAWNQQIQSQQNVQKNYAALNTEIAALQKAVNEHQGFLKTSKEEWQTRIENLYTQLEKNYLPRKPQYKVNQKIYSYNPSTLTALAHVSDLSAWKLNNYLYFDVIVKESLVLEYDARYRNVVVAKLIPESIFDQMGLKIGDRILNIDGVVLNRGDDLRERLLTPKNALINIVRNEQKMSLALQYQQPENVVKADALSPKKIQISDVNFQNQQAVKVVGVSADNSLFQPEDVILSVNGETPGAKDFFSTVQSQNTMSFNIVRDGKNQKLDVAISQPTSDF